MTPFPEARAPRVLLAGCGDLGAHIGLRLHRQGWQVTGVKRRPPSSPLPFPVQTVDLSDPGVRRLPEADAVVVALTADRPDADGYELAYRQTLRGLARTLRQPPERLVFVSSTSVLGDYHGETVTEQTPAVPTRSTARVLKAAEEDARDLFPQVTILRPAGIYGPGRLRTISKVQRAEVADHALMTNRIHRDDLVSAAVALLETPQIVPLVHVVDRQPAPLGDVLRFIASTLGVPVPPHAGPSADTRSPRGKVIDGSLVHRLLGAGGLMYPTYREGYAHVISTL
ncbi:NAD-dependent epimerase/dehydratase family protein [Nesterenkonia flava]|uniref:NAD-dependent epimerase/dehydratase family protein n=1 Tax=Nesterenkonia flava TaxID=469799 RepID=A0ABU1FRP2_9MICC|nr:NAD-dependent epimerase/dehydratase family protein [Nesterenkonia flava]MDR5711289.1 NAD-dependent epimerase/dehydratase family protein [Nesterenkonia flava]